MSRFNEAAIEQVLNSLPKKQLAEFLTTSIGVGMLAAEGRACKCLSCTFLASLNDALMTREDTEKGG